MLVPVPPSLARYVKCARYLPASTITGDYARLPDGEVELLVRPQGITLVGARSTLLVKPTTNDAPALVVRFRLGGAYPFFGGPMSELTDEVLPLADVVRPPPAARVLGWLDARLARGDVFEPMNAPRLRAALASFATRPPPRTVQALAAELGASDRQLRRLCDDAIGLSPKRLLRALRLRAALRAARRTKHPSWSSIAHATGYYDQAHLISEFRALLGTTPAAWSRRPHPPAPRPPDG